MCAEAPRDGSLWCLVSGVDGGDGLDLLRFGGEPHSVIPGTLSTARATLGL